MMAREFKQTGWIGTEYDNEVREWNKNDWIIIETILEGKIYDSISEIITIYEKFFTAVNHLIIFTTLISQALSDIKAKHFLLKRSLGWKVER